MKIADEYFNNCRKIVANNFDLNKYVRYNVFAREDGIACGCNKSVNFIMDNTYGKVKIFGLKDGDSFGMRDPLLIIEGQFEELVTLETTILGFLSFSGCATSMKEIVDEAKGIPIIDMSARHFPWQIIEEVSLAAYLGGASGTSTQAGWEYVQKWHNPGDKFKLYASLPHAMAAIELEWDPRISFRGIPPCFQSVKAARDFQITFPDKPITVLVDYEGQELDVAKQAFEIFGDKLFAVRIDTHSGRTMQGCDELNIPELEKLYGRKNPYTFHYFVSGDGVTVNSAFTMRRYLDSIGANNVKIVVSSGFTKEKIKAFIDLKAPIDFIGTGSWVRFMMITADITHKKDDNDVWIKCGKAGRYWKDGENLKLLFERK